MDDPATRSFIEHTVSVQASMFAEAMWLRTIVDSQRAQLNELAK